YAGRRQVGCHRTSSAADPALPLSPFGNGGWHSPASIVPLPQARWGGDERRSLPTRTITDTSTPLPPHECPPPALPAPRVRAALCRPSPRSLPGGAKRCERQWATARREDFGEVGGAISPAAELPEMACRGDTFSIPAGSIRRSNQAEDGVARGGGAGGFGGGAGGGEAGAGAQDAREDGGDVGDDHEGR